MFSRLRKRLTYTNVAMTLALVFAMTGGAYAASKFVITSTKQIKPSVLKQLQGKTGKTGAAGANGTNGAPGTPGEKGAAGTNGTNGTNGAPGTSVTGAAATAGECPAGGEKYTSASGSVPVCNGKDGLTGFTSTLPKGKTETGAWFVPANATTTETTTISFPIPLAAALAGGQVHYITVAEWEGGTPPTGCGGTAEKPLAEEGFLCIFEGALSNPVGGVESGGILTPAKFALGAGQTGALLSIESKAVGSSFAGTWAVTAP